MDGNWRRIEVCRYLRDCLRSCLSAGITTITTEPLDQVLAPITARFIRLTKRSGELCKTTLPAPVPLVELIVKDPMKFVSGHKLSVHLLVTTLHCVSAAQPLRLSGNEICLSPSAAVRLSAPADGLDGIVEETGK